MTLTVGLDKVVIGSRVGSQSDKRINEDSHWPYASPEMTKFHPIDYLIAGRLYIVADGVSRGLSGDVASHLAVQTIAETYYTHLLHLAHYPSLAELTTALHQAILQADKVLLNESRKQRLIQGITDQTSYLQTTVACSLLRGQQLITAYVGDSRIYRLRTTSTNPQQFEVTHLLPQGQVGDNKYFVGSNLQPDQIWLCSHPLALTDMLLLCSDGLYKYLVNDNNSTKVNDFIAAYKQSYGAGGLEQMGRELLSWADEPRQGGGGDNITLMLIEPSFAVASSLGADLPSATPSTALSDDEMEQLIAQLWQKGPDGFSDMPQALLLARLAELCQTKAKQLVEKDEWQASQVWSRQARQLQSQGEASLAPLQEAQHLVKKLTLNLAKNEKIFKKIIQLYGQTPEDIALGKLALQVTTDLANLMLLEQSEKTNEPLLHETQNWLSRLNNKFGANLSPTEKASPAATLQQLAERARHPQVNSGLPQSLRSVILAKSSYSTKMLWPFLSIWRGVVIAALAWVIVALGLVWLLKQNLVSTPAQQSPGPSAPSSMSVAKPSPTPVLMVTTHSSATTPTIASQLPPSLDIVEIISEPVIIPGARKKIRLTTRLSIQANNLSSASSPELIVQTLAPVGLSPIGGAPELDITHLLTGTLVIQRQPLDNLNTKNLSLSSLYIVEPPPISQPTYTFTIQSNLVNSAQQVLNQATGVASINIKHTPGLSVTQTVTPTQAVWGDLITHTLILYNTGQTYLSGLRLNQTASQLNGLSLLTPADFAAVLDLAPGEKKVVMVSTQVITPYGILTPRLAVEAVLPDKLIQAHSSPVQLTIYPEGLTTTPPSPQEFPHPVWPNAGGAVADEQPLYWLQENDITLKIVDVAQVNGEVWYKIEVEGQPVAGWLWSGRVKFNEAEALAETIRTYLEVLAKNK